MKLNHATAAARLFAGREQQFDPSVVDAFARIPMERWISIPALAAEL